MCAVAENCKKTLKPLILKVQGHSRSSMLTPLKSPKRRHLRGDETKLVKDVLMLFDASCRLHAARHRGHVDVVLSHLIAINYYVQRQVSTVYYVSLHSQNTLWIVLKRMYFTAVIEGVFCLDARVIRNARRYWLASNYEHL